MNPVHPSICFVALHAYNVLTGREDLTHIGGAEVQQVMLARGLRKLGWDVSFVVLDHGQRAGEAVDGIRVFPAYRAAAGIAGLRFLHPRLSGLWSAMKRADADIYYQRCAGSETGQVAMWCRRHRRRFVYGVAHDSNCEPDLPALKAGRERWLYRTGLAQADLVIAQSTTQQERLRSAFGRDSILIRNGLSPLPMSPDSPAGTGPEERSGLLWVGRFSAAKRLEWCLDAAERLRAIRFAIAGTAGSESPVTRAAVRRAESLDNVTLVGFVPRPRMRRYYRQAWALLCTSRAEGFPNTFLEAWSCGTPVISTVDPDNLIRANGLGAVGCSVEELCASARSLIGDTRVWADHSARCLSYVQEHHGEEATALRLHEALESLLSCGRAGTVRTTETSRLAARTDGARP